MSEKQLSLQFDENGEIIDPFITPAGSPYKEIKRLNRTTGQLEVIKTINVQDVIDSYFEETNYKEIARKLHKTNASEEDIALKLTQRNSTPLNQIGEELDLTQVPTDYFEADVLINKYSEVLKEAIKPDMDTVLEEQK